MKATFGGEYGFFMPKQALDSLTAQRHALSQWLGRFVAADPTSGLHEFLHLQTHQGPLPERDADGRLPITGSTGIVFVLLPGGTFRMGSPSGESTSQDDRPDPDEFEANDVSLAPFLDVGTILESLFHDHVHHPVLYQT